jgi:hypothetical protein
LWQVAIGTTLPNGTQLVNNFMHPSIANIYEEVGNGGITTGTFENATIITSHLSIEIDSIHFDVGNESNSVAIAEMNGKIVSMPILINTIF